VLKSKKKLVNMQNLFQVNFFLTKNKFSNKFSSVLLANFLH